MKDELQPVALTDYVQPGGERREGHRKALHIVPLRSPSSGGPFQGGESTKVSGKENLWLVAQEVGGQWTMGRGMCVCISQETQCC